MSHPARPFFLLLLLLACALCLPAPAAAAAGTRGDNATACLKKSADKNSQKLTNDCDVDLVVVWCHDKDQKGWRDGLCGQGKDFYRKSAVLKPGESLGNLYSTPLGHSLTFGACIGGYSALRKLEDGGYACTQPVAAMDVTVRDGTQQAACEEARAAATARTVTMTGCACKVRGAAAVCRLTLVVPYERPGVMKEVQAWARERFQCSAAEKNCARMVSIGIRQ